MGQLSRVLETLSLANPWAAVAVLTVLAGAWLVGRWVRPKPTRVPLSALQGVPPASHRLARLARLTTSGLLVVIAILTAALWSELTSDSTGEGGAISDVRPARTLLAVFDISSSMATPFGSGVEGSRFTIAQEALAAFLGEQVQALASERERLQAGVIFFSTDVLDYRRPTQDIGALVTELRQLDITRESGQQLADLSWGTETAQALSHASSMLTSLDLPSIRSGAVILVSDLLDDKLELAEAINNLTDRSIRVYILSIEGRGAEPSAAVADALALNPQVFAFHIRLPEDMRIVYSAIGDLESSRALDRVPVPIRTRAARMGVLALLALVLLFVVVSDAVFPRVRSAT